MTAPAKIAANRRNALRSTGPRTSAGKLVVAQNAVQHGVFANLPVVPGESDAGWQSHCQGVLDSLVPVGLLERTLAERVALLLWRLARLARYEAANTLATVEDAGLLPSHVDPIPYSQARRHHHEAQLRFARQELRRVGEELAVASRDADIFREAMAGGGPAVLPTDRAQAVLVQALLMSNDRPGGRGGLLWPNQREFQERLGLDPARSAEGWPREDFLAGVDLYASATGWSIAQFRRELQGWLDAWVAEQTRMTERWRVEVDALSRRLESERDRAAAAALLPPEVASERIMRYEKHLHGQLTSTLHELERLQAKRGGEFVPPPAVADLHVLINGE